VSKPEREGFWWVRSHGGDPKKPFWGTPPDNHLRQYMHERKQLSTSFPTRHFFCDYCGEHFEGCCPTEYVIECKDPARCAFNKEMELG
jgi:hypothetical protein